MKTRVIQDDPDGGQPAEVDAPQPGEPPVSPEASTTSGHLDPSASDRAIDERHQTAGRSGQE